MAYSGFSRSFSLLTWTLCLMFVCVENYPVPQDGYDKGPDGEINNGFSPSPLFVTLAVVASICAVSAVAMCTCCHDVLFSPKGDTSDTLPRRYSMEPPSDSSLSPSRNSHAEVPVTIEPLPDIASTKSGKTYTKPMGYNQVINKGPDVSDWFRSDVNVPDFPRGQLQYVKELGQGWFGSVVEGEASKMSPQRRKVKVVVQILREDLTSMERAYMLYTAKMFRDVSHENVLKIIGKCVDKEPYLLLYEHCPQGDFLKSYLIARRGVSDDLVHSGAVLKMCCEVADGLVALHQKGFIHSDLACRNCLVSSNGTVKIGDYGTGFSVFKDEYLTVGDIAVPIRWISPDSVDVAASGQLVTKEVSQVDNVWTLGVVVWEILEFAKLPYMELNDEGVVNGVLKTRSVYLQSPLVPLPQRDRLYEVMRFCWLPSSSRPSSEQIASLLKQIFQFRPAIDSMDDFDAKWNSMVAAQKPALLATEKGDNSYSPVPTDPSILRGMEIKGASPVSTPVTLPEPGFSDGVVQSSTLISPVSNPLAGIDEQINTVQEHPLAATTIPDSTETDLERIEKRNFILTLSLADLAAMKSGDLVEFYEYLSQDEIKDLEQRHAMAVEETEEIKEKQKKRDIFLAMTLDEMDELTSEELEDYMKCLDELDRNETREKLGKRKEEKEKKKLMEEMRKRILAMSDEEIMELSENQLNEIGSNLSMDESESLKRRWEQLLEAKDRREKAEMVFDLEDRELAGLGKDEVEAACSYLAQDKADILRKKYEKLWNMKLLVSNATDDELCQLTDGEFEHYANILPFDEAEEIRNRRKDGMERKRRIEEKRNAVMEMTPVELAKSGVELESLWDVLTDEELESLRKNQQEAVERRREALSFDGDKLKSLEKDELAGYYSFLTPDEIDRLESLRTAPPSVVESHSPSAQGSLLAEEALRSAKEQLTQQDHTNELPLSLQNQTPEKTTRLMAGKRDSVPPLSITSLNTDGGGWVMPLATPELRKEHDSKREKILVATDDELNSMSQDDFEHYFQYLSTEEIFDLEERRRLSKMPASMERNLESDADNASMVSGDTTDRIFGNSAWEARDYVLHMSDNQLAHLNSDDLKKLSNYFSSEEFKRIEMRWTDVCEKLDFLKQSTDEELAVMQTEKLEDYLNALPEEERADIRERVNIIQTRWLPATLRDEEAFRDILKTVPSISASESESAHVHEPINVTQKQSTPPNSVDVEEVVVNVENSFEDENQNHQQHHQQVQRQFEDLFDCELRPISPKGGGLAIPELRLQAATPVHEMSMNSELAFPAVTPQPLNMDEDGLEDTDGHEHSTSTPVFESFADSILNDIGPFGSLTQDETTYVTANADLWDKSTPETVMADSYHKQEQQVTAQDSNVGDLLGDFGQVSNGDFGNTQFHGNANGAGEYEKEDNGEDEHTVKKETPTNLLD